MKIHALQTGTVRVKPSQRVGRGRGSIRQLNILLDRSWTESLPIYAWAIETVDGVIIVDTGETARTREPGYFPRWHPYFRLAVRLDVTPEQMVRGRRPEYRLRNRSRRFSAAHPQTRTPQGSPRGETESRFLWVCRVKVVGQTVQGTPTGDSWSYGLRRRIDPSPADRGLEEDHDALRYESLHRRFIEVWEIGPGDQESCPSPGASLHPARSCRRCVRLFAESVHPSDHVGETFGIPSPA